VISTEEAGEGEGQKQAETQDGRRNDGTVKDEKNDKRIETSEKKPGAWVSVSPSSSASLDASLARKILVSRETAGGS